MMYKLLPVVTAVAAERFLAAPVAFPGGQGEGYDLTAPGKVKSKAHGYSDGNKLIYLLNGGTAQHPLADGTEYTVASKTADDFQVGVTLTAADATGYTAQTEAATWNPCTSAADCAEKLAAANSDAFAGHDGTADTVFTAATHGFEAEDLVLFRCKGATAACPEGLANNSIWTVKSVETNTFKVKAATGTGALKLAAGAATNKAQHGTACGTGNVDCHRWVSVNTAWKSITTAAPSAASSNFNVMVATVASGFLYLLM